MLGLAARASEGSFLAMCDMGWCWELHTICDDLVDFRHDTKLNQLESHSPTLLLEPQYACCSEPHGLTQHLQEPGLGASDTNITRTRDKTDCYSYKSIQILQTPTAFCTQESVRKESLGTILQLFVMLRLLVADSGPFQDHSYPFSSSCQQLLFLWWILAQRPLEKKWNKRGWKITAQKHCFWLVFSLQERMWQDLLRREALTWIHSKQSLHSRRQDLNLAKVRECSSWVDVSQSISIYASVQTSFKDFHRISWISVKFHECSWAFWDFHRFPSTSVNFVDFHGFSLIVMGFRGAPMRFHSSISLVFCACEIFVHFRTFPWILVGFTGFHRVSRLFVDFTDFHSFSMIFVNFLEFPCIWFFLDCHEFSSMVMDFGRLSKISWTFNPFSMILVELHRFS